MPWFQVLHGYSYGSLFFLHLESQSLRVSCEPLVIVTLVNRECSIKIHSQAGDGFVILQGILSKSMFANMILPKLFINVWMFSIESTSILIYDLGVMGLAIRESVQTPLQLEGDP